MKNSKAVKASAARREFAGKLLKAFAGETAAKTAPKAATAAKSKGKPATVKPAATLQALTNLIAPVLGGKTKPTAAKAPAAKSADVAKAPAAKAPKTKAPVCSKCGRQNKRPAGATDGDCNSKDACDARRKAAAEAAKGGK